LDWCGRLAEEPILRPELSKQGAPEVLLSESFYNGVIATVESWTFPYQGNVANVAYDYLNSCTDPNIYARILTIVQSSGMGKSRMVDEFSKEHFVIPLNLRDGNQGDLNPLSHRNCCYNAGCTGYPAPDGAVRDWFRKSGDDAAQNTNRFIAFLTALFQETLLVINELPSIKERILSCLSIPELERENMLRDFPESLAGMFRLFMTAGQLFSKQGDLRIEFYNSVLERADNVSHELYSAPPSQLSR
jgi:hypothetical protein